MLFSNLNHDSARFGIVSHPHGIGGEVSDARRAWIGPVHVRYGNTPKLHLRISLDEGWKAGTASWQTVFDYETLTSMANYTQVPTVMQVGDASYEFASTRMQLHNRAGTIHSIHMCLTC